MKKLLFPLALAACVAGTAQGQARTQNHSLVGVKVGGSAATFVGDVPKNQRLVYGINAGVFANFNLIGPVSIQPELLFSMKGNQEPASYVLPTTTRLNYLELPIAFRASTESGLFAETGPQVSYLLSANYKNPDGKDEDVKSAYRDIDAGAFFGIGYQPKQGGFGVGARYSYSVLTAPKNLLDSAPMNNSLTNSYRNTTFQLYVSYAPTHYHKPRKRSHQ
jgi:hypothetical protein